MSTTTASETTVVVVTGERAAERVATLRRPGDLCADHDALRHTIDPDDTAGPAGRQAAHAAWCALVDRARVVAGQAALWIVHEDPTPEQVARYELEGYLVVSPTPRRQHQRVRG